MPNADHTDSEFATQAQREHFIGCIFYPSPPFSRGSTIPHFMWLKDNQGLGQLSLVRSALLAIAPLNIRQGDDRLDASHRLPPSDAVRKQKTLFQRIFSVHYCHNHKNITPSGNLKFKNLSIFLSLKFRISMEKNPSNSY